MPARLDSLVRPSRVVDLTTQYLVDVKQWPNGKTTSVLRAANPLRTLKAEFDGIDAAGYATLLAHYASAKGRHLPFLLADNHTGTLYTVRYADDSLARTSAVPNVTGLYSFAVTFQEDR